MNYIGIIIAGITLLIIGVFHPIVVWAEYRFSKKIWPLFLAGGIVFLIISLRMSSDFASCVSAVLSATLFWCIKELFEQEKRVARGWFPKNDKREK